MDGNGTWVLTAGAGSRLADRMARAHPAAPPKGSGDCGLQGLEPRLALSDMSEAADVAVGREKLTGTYAMLVLYCTVPLNDTTGTPPCRPQPSRRKRWTPVSQPTSTRSTDSSGATQYACLCWCESPFLECDDEHDSNSEGVTCDSGKTCFCGSPARDHPDLPLQVPCPGHLQRPRGIRYGGGG